MTVVLTAGVLGASATALAKLQESADGSTSWQDVATTVTLVKATDDGKTVQATGKCSLRYVRVRVRVGTAASLCGATILAKRRTLTYSVQLGRARGARPSPRAWPAGRLRPACGLPPFTRTGRSPHVRAGRVSPSSPSASPAAPNRRQDVAC